jgi:hypothetical protein
MSETKPVPASPPPAPEPKAEPKPQRPAKKPMPKEIGGPSGPEPTRYGDWERKGRVSDF